VLVFICVIVTLDVLYIHEKGFGQSLAQYSFGFGPPQPEQRQEKPQDKKEEVVEKAPVEEPKEKKVVEEKKVEVVEDTEKKEEVKQEEVVVEQETDEHRVAGLSCKAYGGPSDEDAAEMVFWSDIPEDATFVSPYKRNETQYLTFEPGTYCTTSEIVLM
jgi:hypothetical protein